MSNPPPPSYQQAVFSGQSMKDPTENRQSESAPQQYGGEYGGTFDEENPADYSDDVGFVGTSFSDKAVRRAFIRKVYSILMLQLLVTAAVIAIFVFHRPTQKWVQANPGVYWASYGVFLVTYIALICCPNLRRQTPWNFIALSFFTLAFSYMCAMISSYYKIESVMIALGITAAVCLGLTIFAMQTKIDFTLCSGLLFALLLTLILFGLVTIIVGSINNFDSKSWKVMNYVYGGLGSLVFSLFLVFDTQLIIGGNKYEISPEEYIFGAVQLYLDVVYIFLFILQIIGGGGRGGN